MPDCSHRRLVTLQSHSNWQRLAISLQQCPRVPSLSQTGMRCVGSTKHDSMFSGSHEHKMSVCPSVCLLL